MWNDGSDEQDRYQLIARNYSVTLTDAEGCALSRTIMVSEPEPLLLTLTTSPDCALASARGIVAGNAAGGTAPYTFTPSVPMITLRAGVYNVTVTDANGCSATETAVVLNDMDNPECVDPIDVQIAQVLTPNGDGIMDEWNIMNIHEFSQNETWVFNRWGDLVYRKAPYMNNWYGTYFDSGKDLPDGTYFYIVHLNDLKDRKFQGFVVIRR